MPPRPYTSNSARRV